MYHNSISEQVGLGLRAIHIASAFGHVEIVKVEREREGERERGEGRGERGEEGAGIRGERRGDIVPIAYSLLFSSYPSSCVDPLGLCRAKCESRLCPFECW